MREVLVGAMQEAMPYEQLDKLVNEDLLNQYIESRYSFQPCRISFRACQAPCLHCIYLSMQLCCRLLLWHRDP